MLETLPPKNKTSPKLFNHVFSDYEVVNSVYIPYTNYYILLHFRFIKEQRKNFLAKADMLEVLNIMFLSLLDSELDKYRKLITGRR